MANFRAIWCIASLRLQLLIYLLPAYFIRSWHVDLCKPYRKRFQKKHEAFFYRAKIVADLRLKICHVASQKVNVRLTVEAKMLMIINK